MRRQLTTSELEYLSNFADNPDYLLEYARVRSFSGMKLPLSRAAKSSGFYRQLQIAINRNMEAVKVGDANILVDIRIAAFEADNSYNELLRKRLVKLEAEAEALKSDVIRASKNGLNYQKVEEKGPKIEKKEPNLIPSEPTAEFLSSIREIEQNLSQASEWLSSQSKTKWR